MRLLLVAACVVVSLLVSSCLVHELPATSDDPASPIRISTRNSSCAIRAAGEVWCWAPTVTPTRVPGIDDAIEVSMMADGLCVLRRSGVVACGAPGSLTPIAGLSPVRISAGTFRVCAVDALGHVACWGQRFGSADVDATPVVVAGLDGVVEVAVGWSSACARRTGGDVVCWGEGAEGQLGDGRMASSDVPVTATGVTDALQIAVGSSHACARVRGGRVLCWGQHPSDGVENRIDPVPTEVPGLGAAHDVSAGYYLTCALLAGGDAWCWGLGTYGQLLDGTLADRDVAPHATGFVGITATSPGHVYSCVEDDAGVVSCAGYGYPTAEPVVVEGLP